ncbi:O-antigen ligase family protein [Clostridium thermarum]|uniref:O-antigen ligase family protein n=1 Tax=Clostridium thermarum TaxID=1716543 RepID=UPI00111E810A|nr:O-antigen ligase [Clostridium thermarum]
MKKIRDIINVIFLFFISGGFYSSSNIALIGISFANIIILLVSFLNIKRAKFDFLSCKYIITFIIYIFLSCTWAYDSRNTLINAFIFTGTVAYSLNMFFYYDECEFIRYMSFFNLSSAILSIFLVIFLPDIGTYYDDRFFNWRGYFALKNGFGRTMALGYVFSLLNFISEKSKFRKLTALLAMALAVLCVSKSNSSTSLVILLISTVAILSYKFINAYIIIIGTFISGIIFYILFFLQNNEWFGSIASQLLQYFNRDITLTGRTGIWNFSIEAMKLKPLLGYGYHGFWYNNPYSYYFSMANEFMIGHSHNGYIDLLLDLGVIGTIVFFIMIINYVIKCLAYYKIKKHINAYFYVFFICLYIIINFIEGEFLRSNSIFMVSFVCLNYYLLQLKKSIK